MNIAKDVVDKYTVEQIVAALDIRLNGIIQNYKNGLKTGRSEFVWGSLGDLVEIKEILHEMRTRNDAKEAMKQNMV